jgi:hypothetical protein
MSFRLPSLVQKASKDAPWKSRGKQYISIYMIGSENFLFDALPSPLELTAIEGDSRPSHCFCKIFQTTLSGPSHALGCVCFFPRCNLDQHTCSRYSILRPRRTSTMHRIKCPPTTGATLSSIQPSAKENPNTLNFFY